MKEYIDMKQYGLTENFQSEVNKYKNLSVARILSQEKGLYRIVSSQGKNWRRYLENFSLKQPEFLIIRQWVILLW